VGTSAFSGLFGCVEMMWHLMEKDYTPIYRLFSGQLTVHVSGAWCKRSATNNY
jgi:hypothetical protein